MVVKVQIIVINTKSKAFIFKESVLTETQKKYFSYAYEKNNEKY